MYNESIVNALQINRFFHRNQHHDQSVT